MIEVAGIGTMLRPEDHDRALRGESGLLGSVAEPSYGIGVRAEDAGGQLQDSGGRGEVVSPRHPAGRHLAEARFP